MAFLAPYASLGLSGENASERGLLPLAEEAFGICGGGRNLLNPPAATRFYQHPLHAYLPGAEHCACPGGQLPPPDKADGDIGWD